MGCWNATCGLSNLPIQAGDDVLLFVLAHSKLSSRDLFGGGFSYPNGRYRPIGLPVHGQYNDYGGIENVTENGHRMFEFLTTDRMFKYTPHGDEDLTPETIEELLNKVIQRGNSTYSTMFVRKDILDGMKAQNVSGYADLATQFDQFKTGYQAELDHVKAENEAKDKDVYNDYLLTQLTEMNLGEVLGYQNLFGEVLLGHEMYPQRSFLRLARTTPHTDVQEGLIDVLFVNRLLGDLRKFWTPQSGAGSQDNDHDVHLALCQTMTEVCAKRDEENDFDE